MAATPRSTETRRHSAVPPPARPAALAAETAAGHQAVPQAVVHRLRRVEGQIRGVMAMIEQEKPCDAIAQQLSAARRALDRAFFELVACTLEEQLDGSADSAALRARVLETTRLLAKYA